jgi:hypothetical protein
MAVTIVHKASSTAAATPAVSAIALGEFAINVADGELFFRQLIDPAQAATEANTRIFAVRRPPIADGGEITGGSPPPPPTSGTPLMLAETLDSIYNYDWYN